MHATIFLLVHRNTRAPHERSNLSVEAEERMNIPFIFWGSRISAIENAVGWDIPTINVGIVSLSSTAVLAIPYKNFELYSPKKAKTGSLRKSILVAVIATLDTCRCLMLIQAHNSYLILLLFLHLYSDKLSEFFPKKWSVSHSLADRECICLHSHLNIRYGMK